jgi:hypothetical protein
MKFKSSYDSTVIIISLIIIALTFYFLKRELISFKSTEIKTVVHFFLHFKFSILLLLLLLVSYALSTKFYVLNDKGIVIKKRVGEKTISYNEIEWIKSISALDSYIRIFGIGGLFGYNGIFLSTSSQLIYLYMNHRNNLIQIKRYNKPLIYISPDDAKEFIGVCKSKNLIVFEEN